MKLLRPAFILIPSNSTGLKPGLLICSQRPRKFTLYPFQRGIDQSQNKTETRSPHSSKKGFAIFLKADFSHKKPQQQGRSVRCVLSFKSRFHPVKNLVWRLIDDIPYPRKNRQFGNTVKGA
jgi:hypothetical protein